jgi:hypothetical protein
VNWACDFGCNANGGVTSASSRTVLTEAFERATAGGMHTIRWWVFPGDPWQITRDGAGRPTGINPSVYADFDAALRLADAHDLYFDFVLFSSPTSVPAAWITDPSQRASLATALAPLFARYRGNPRVLAWEVFNEPEFDIWSGKIAQAPVQATVKAIADSVHANSTAYVTVGSAHLDGLSMWVGQGLDFYQAHWYDYMSGGGWCARCTDYATVRDRFGLDGPLVIGEFYAGPETDSLQRFEDFYAKGYAGAWPWSLLPGRTNDNLATDLAAAQTFASRHTDLSPRAGTVPATPTTLPATPTNTAVPGPTATATVRPTNTAVPSPTATATVRPTGTAPPGATSTPATAPVFTLATSASAARVAPGQTIQLSTSVTSQMAGTWLVDVEVYDASGRRVFQQSYDNQSFHAGQVRRYTPSWQAPGNAPTGRYTVMVGVFSVGWSTLYSWDAAAARFSVSR